MGAYIKGLITASVISGIIMAAVPESKDNGLRKYVKYVTSLLLLIALISPVVPLLTDIESFGESIREQAKSLTSAYTGGYTGDMSRSSELILEESLENIKEGIAGVIAQKFRIPAEAAEISLECDSSDISNIVITKIIVEITGESVTQIKGYLIEEYLGEYFSCECIVRFGD